MSWCQNMVKWRGVLCLGDSNMANGDRKGGAKMTSAKMSVDTALLSKLVVAKLREISDNGPVVLTKENEEEAIRLYIKLDKQEAKVKELREAIRKVCKFNKN